MRMQSNVSWFFSLFRYVVLYHTVPAKSSDFYIFYMIYGSPIFGSD